jgi:hypothetical protein
MVDYCVRVFAELNDLLHPSKQSSMSWNIIIISGGQTGADRAALDFAIKHEIPHGGMPGSGLT